MLSSEHIKIRARLTSRTTTILRQISQNQAYICSESRTSLKLLLLFGLVEHTVLDKPYFLHRRAQQQCLWTYLRLRSAEVHGSRVLSALLLHLSFYLFTALCNHLFTTFCSRFLTSFCFHIIKFFHFFSLQTTATSFPYTFLVSVLYVASIPPPPLRMTDFLFCVLIQITDDHSFSFFAHTPLTLKLATLLLFTQRRSSPSGRVRRRKMALHAQRFFIIKLYYLC